MTDELAAVANGRIMGRLRLEPNRRIVFVYETAWREARDAFPLSLSMPLVDPTHGGRTVETFLWGLLPDNAAILERWARRFQISPRSPFALIAHVGEDCAGAVQFVRPDRLDVVLDDGPEDIEWLDEAGVAARLRALAADHSAWRAPRDAGQFSLAGAQPKTALTFRDGRWGVPSGRTPTTHILKPPTDGFAGHAENENLCLTAARRLDLPATRSAVRRFEDQTAIVVARYDRVSAGDGPFRRIHQEDLCQSLSVPPAAKYQHERGPGPEAVVDLLRRASTRPEEDVRRFVDALAFNWLIGGTDAHAKNYSILIAGSGQVRLAPLYDVASYLPYEADPHRTKLAMKIGGEYHLRRIGMRQWAKLAATLRLNADALRTRLLDMATRLPDALSEASAEMAASGLRSPAVEGLNALLIRRAADLATSMTEA